MISHLQSRNVKHCVSQIVRFSISKMHKLKTDSKEGESFKVIRGTRQVVGLAMWVIL